MKDWEPLVALVAAVIAAVVPFAPTSAHQPAATLACVGDRAELTVDATGYDGGQVVIEVDGTTVVDQAFAEQFHTSRGVGSGLVAHDVTVDIKAADDPDGTRGYSRTFDLHAPACVTHRDTLQPRAGIEGPCGDPLYRFVLDNERSDRAVRFRILSHLWPTGVLEVTRYWVPAHSTVVTPYSHVLGGTKMKVTALHQVLRTRVSAPGGSYGKCPK